MQFCSFDQNMYKFVEIFHHQQYFVTGFQKSGLNCSVIFQEAIILFNPSYLLCDGLQSPKCCTGDGSIHWLSVNRQIINGQLDLLDFQQVFSDFRKIKSCSYRGLVGDGGGVEGMGGRFRYPPEQPRPTMNQTSSPLDPRPQHRSSTQ